MTDRPSDHDGVEKSETEGHGSGPRSPDGPAAPLPGLDERGDDLALVRMLAIAFVVGLLMIGGMVVFIWRLVT